MLIVGNTRDYYDSVRVYGIDKTCVYQRNRQELKGEFSFQDGRQNYKDYWPREEEFQRTKKGIVTKWIASKYVIGYCGKLYPMILVEKSTPEETEIFGLYSYEEVKEFFVNEGINLAQSLWGYFSQTEFSVKSEESMISFFSGEAFKTLEAEFYLHKCPVFVYGYFKHPDDVLKHRAHELLVLNPRLKDFKFMKIKDPQTAFQDIFMYLSGVLGVSAPEMVELTDKELAKKKGHDGRYSFRTPPKKRKKHAKIRKSK